MADDLALLLKDGLDHFREGRLSDAIAAFEEVLRVDPGNRRAKEFLNEALSGGKALGFISPGGVGGHSTGPVQTSPPDSAGVQGPSSAPPDPGDPAGWDPDALSAESGDWSPFEVDPSTPTTGDSPEPRSPAHLAELDDLLHRARGLLESGDFTGAMEAAESVLALEQGHLEASTIHARCADALLQEFEERLGERSGIPRLKMPPDEVLWLDLDPSAGFLLSQMDGHSSLDDLFAISALSELETARLLCQLLDSGVIGFD